MTPPIWRLKIIAHYNGFNVKGFKPLTQLGRSLVSVEVKKTPLNQYAIVLSVPDELKGERGDEILFHAGRTLEARFEAVKPDSDAQAFAGFKVKRVPGDDPMTWDGKKMIVDVLVRLDWCLGENAQ